jgi:hypothetical protein
MNINCTNCNITFDKKPSEMKKTKNHFCTRNCAASFNNRGKRRHPPRTCKKCNLTYVTSKTHRSLSICIDCTSQINTTEQIKKMSKKDYRERESVKNRHPSWLNSHIRNFNRSWNSELRKLPCQKCGYNTHVELAHIKGIKDFNDDSTIEEINSPDNILVLCPNHHWEFDNGILKIQDIPSR